MLALFRLSVPAAATAVGVSLVATAALPAQMRADWPGFRGAHHDGVAATAKPPKEWASDRNLLWSVELPGPGSSSPIVAGDRVWVYSYSGYGAYLDDGGDREKLVHHLSCYAAADGKLLWTNAVPGPLEQDARRIQISQHGFASPTPILSGERIYCYFGRAGVVAFDLDGKQLWQTDLGHPDPDFPIATNQIVQDGKVIPLRWGSATSPVLHDGLVIVNCSEESNSIRALRQDTGELVWQHESSNLEGTAVTPVVLGKGEDAVLVITLGGAIWGMAPKTGKMLWQVETATGGGMSSMPVADDELAYVFGGDDVSYAVRWRRDAEEPRVVWESKSVAIPSPLLYAGKLLAVRSSGFGLWLEPSSGEVKHEARLDGRTSQVYASPVIADGRIYVVSRKRGTFVYAADGTFELLARNELDDDSQFNASPAIASDRLFLRSDTKLYCIGAGEAGDGK